MCPQDFGSEDVSATANRAVGAGSRAVWTSAKVGYILLGTEDLTHFVIRCCILLIGNEGSEILTMKKELLTGSRYIMSLLLATGHSTRRGASLGARGAFHFQGYL